jgi:hypothetical protein
MQKSEEVLRNEKPVSAKTALTSRLLEGAHILRELFTSVYPPLAFDINLHPRQYLSLASRQVLLARWRHIVRQTFMLLILRIESELLCCRRS